MNKPIKFLLIFCITLVLIGCAPNNPPQEIMPPAEPENESVSSISPESVRDEVAKFMLDQHSEEVGEYFSDITWNKLPEPATHTLAIYRFESEYWQMSISVLPAGVFEIDEKVLEEDAYSVELTFLNSPPFIRWVGVYTEGAGTVEDSFVVQTQSVEKIAPELARDQAIAFIQQEYPNSEFAQASWELFGSQEASGQSVYAYKFEDYTVTVTWSEYSGTYSVYGLYDGVGDQTIQIEWNVRVSADGNSVNIENYQYFGGE